MISHIINYVYYSMQDFLLFEVNGILLEKESKLHLKQRIRISYI